MKRSPRYPLIILILLLLCSACTTAKQEATSSPETASIPTKVAKVNDPQGILRLPYPLFYKGKESLDPASPVDFRYANHMLYNRLVHLDESGVPAPELATAWTANKDAIEWTFTLRDDVTFHDGHPFTSADVAYTITHILDPKLQSPLAGALGLIAGTKTPNAKTIVFQLKQPYTDFPVLLTSRFAGIIPVGSASTIGKTGIGTGPFKLKTLNVEGTTVLSANDKYWKGVPKLAGIELPGIADSETRILALQSGQVDLLIDTTSTQADLFTGKSDFTVLSYPSGQWTALIMRTDTPPFNDVRVRQAVRLVADRQVMVTLVLKGAGTVACDTPVAPTDTYRLNGDCPQNAKRAKELLAAAGYPNGLDVTLYTTSSVPQFTPLAQVYQQQATAAGIKVNLKIVPADSYFSEVWMVKPFFMSTWVERPADQILNEAWRSTASWNESHYHNPDFDRLLDNARRAVDLKTRRATYQAAQHMLFEQGGSLIPFHLNEFYVMSAKVSGVPARSFNEVEWQTISKSK